MVSYKQKKVSLRPTKPKVFLLTKHNITSKRKGGDWGGNTARRKYIPKKGYGFWIHTSNHVSSNRCLEWRSRNQLRFFESNKTLIPLIMSISYVLCVNYPKAAKLFECLKPALGCLISFFHSYSNLVKCLIGVWPDIELSHVPVHNLLSYFFFSFYDVQKTQDVSNESMRNQGLRNFMSHWTTPLGHISLVFIKMVKRRLMNRGLAHLVCNRVYHIEEKRSSLNLRKPVIQGQGNDKSSLPSMILPLYLPDQAWGWVWVSCQSLNIQDQTCPH